MKTRRAWRCQKSEFWYVCDLEDPSLKRSNRFPEMLMPTFFWKSRASLFFRQISYFEWPRLQDEYNDYRHLYVYEVVGQWDIDEDMRLLRR